MRIVKRRRGTLAIAMCGIALFFCTGHLLAQQTGERIVTEPLEDAQRLCPLVSKELAEKAAAEVKKLPQCDVVCKGCGCKGGPGYRSRSTDRCVGWSEIVSVCGPPPHERCTRECQPVVEGCTGRAWIKGVAAKFGLAVSFLEGTSRANSQRHRDKQQQAEPHPPAEQRAQGLSSDQCGSKKTCKEMTSCEEARHYLKDCGLKRLDGDGDGVPCNSLCRGQ